MEAEAATPEAVTLVEGTLPAGTHPSGTRAGATWAGTLWLAALLVWKGLWPACGIRGVLCFGHFAPSDVTSVEHPQTGPPDTESEDSANPSLVSAAIPTPPDVTVSFVSSHLRRRRGFFFCSFPRFSSSGYFFNGVTQVCFFEPFLPLLSFSGDFDP
jgi:hypothetical protein